MNLIYEIQVQDGDRKRKEFECALLPNDATKEQINAKGREILKERFTGDDEGEWCWDSYGETAGRYYTFYEIKDEESFNIIQRILY